MKISHLTTIKATGKQDNQFVGIRIFDNQIEFHYPETYVLSNDDDSLRKDILSILRTISLAKTKTHELSSLNTEHDKNYRFPLSAYLWIISDYLTYGRYENREKTYQHGARGKIDWKKTLHSIPVISEGNVIYTDIISEKKSQKDNLLTQIYYSCVQTAIDSIGWLYGITFDPNGIDYYRLFNKRLYLSAINTELSHTFDDQKKTRLQNMKNIILGLDDKLEQTREIIYGVDSYDYIYERMVDSLFSNVENIRDFYPNATWDLVLERGPVNSSNLRPDTILIKDNKVYILDAKYYRYGTTFSPGDMPETTSIQKQITYGEYVKNVKLGMYDDVFSAFVMPYSKTHNGHSDIFFDNLVFAGIAKASWVDDADVNSRKIVAVLLDTNYLINNWVHRDNDSINSIISIIENNVRGFHRD